MKKIKGIVKKGLCTGCGACYSVCPNNAIKLLKKDTYVPKIDVSECINCRLCDKVCPAIEENKYSIFKKNQINTGKKYDRQIGNYEMLYVGYAEDKKLRHECSSGGCITALLMELFERKIIDCALLTYFDKDSPTEPMISIASSKEEIIQAKGSKYCPVPYCAGLKKIIDSDYKKVAVVGLGCHMSAINNYAEYDRRFREKIFIRFGLICGQCITHSGMDNFFRKNGIHKKKVKKVSFRGDGWPGKMRVKEQNDLEIEFMEFFGPFVYGFYELKSCVLCNDFTNESVDISFGDAWIKDIMKQDKHGTNIIISRTKKGELILAESKAIMKRAIPVREIKNAYRFRLKSKKGVFIKRLFLFNSFISKRTNASDLFLRVYKTILRLVR